MRILLTCDTLARRSGSQAYTRDVAVGLMRAGHEPIVYSPVPGEVGDDLRKATIPVASHLDQLGAPPDVVHGNHHAELMTALLRFPKAVGLHVCHAWWTSEAYPPRFPRLRRYVAVDETVRDRLVSEEGLPPELVRVILNPVDLARFPSRAPLAARPRRALLFSNYAGETTHLPAVRQACDRTGLDLTVLGAVAGGAVERPEESLVQADVVFAKGRSALEALAAGAAVVLVDTAGSGPMVTSRNFPDLRRRNLGMRTLDRPATAEQIAGEIARYDAADAAETSRLARESASLPAIVGELVSAYEEALADQAAAGPFDREAEERAASDYIRWLDQNHISVRGWTAAAIEGERQSANRRVAEEVKGVLAEAAWMRSTATWKLRSRLLEVPGLQKAWRMIRRRPGSA